jgi:hypothetical protein
MGMAFYAVVAGQACRPGAPKIDQLYLAKGGKIAARAQSKHSQESHVEQEIDHVGRQSLLRMRIVYRHAWPAPGCRQSLRAGRQKLISCTRPGRKITAPAQCKYRQELHVAGRVEQ